VGALLRQMIRGALLTPTESSSPGEQL
jgi:hypothetical protein